MPDTQVCIRVSFVNVLVLLIICAQNMTQYLITN